MDIEKKLAYEPPRLESVDQKLVLGDSIVPGASQVLPPDEDPDF